MDDININYLAVLVTAIIHFVIGGLWYSPILFGNLWMKILDKPKEELKGAIAGYIFSFLASILICFVLSHFIYITKSTSLIEGMQTSFWIWLGFIVTTILPVYYYENRPKGLYLIYIGYQFVGLLVSGAILTIWK